MNIRLSLFILIPVLLLSSCTKERDNNPNVILILTDDQGSVDVNCYGSTDLYTPGMDRLADEGVKFTRFYVGASLCSPSRASILTGKTPQRAGVPGNLSSIPGHSGMPGKNVTIAEVFKNAGYTTAHVGKWHLGFSTETMPLAQGFDYSFGHMGGCIDNYSHFFYWNGPNRHDLWENGKEIFKDGSYFPDLMDRKARTFIRKNKNRPFFLYYALNIPHYPLQPRPSWRYFYSELDMPRRDYAGFVSSADENISRIIKQLNRLHLRKNTIIIFLSDHGQSFEERAFGGGGNSGPFRGGKTSLFEGGIRVPAIISWPGVLPSGVTRNQVLHSFDLLPTLASMCGITNIPEGIEGLDVSENIKLNKQLQDRPLYWKLGSQWAVRSGKWKLIGYPVDPSGGNPIDRKKDNLWLSDLYADSTETVNLAAQYPEVVKELTEKYLKWEFASPDDIPVYQEPLANMARGLPVILGTEPSPKYNGSGPGTLTDNILGTKIYSDGSWLGFEASDLDARVDLGKLTQVDSIIVRFIYNPGAWIFPPLFCEVSLSEDGTRYGKTVRIDCDTTKISGTRIDQYVIKINSKTRYIRVFAKNRKTNPGWHSDPGGKSWIFTDEIMVR